MDASALEQALAHQEAGVCSSLSHPANKRGVLPCSMVDKLLSRASQVLAVNTWVTVLLRVSEPGCLLVKDRNLRAAKTQQLHIAKPVTEGFIL